MHELRQNMFRLNNERDPRRYQQRGFEIGVYAVATLHATIMAYGARAPTPTVRSNAFHFLSEVSRRPGFAAWPPNPIRPSSRSRRAAQPRRLAA